MTKHSIKFYKRYYTLFQLSNEFSIYVGEKMNKYFIFAIILSMFTLSGCARKIIVDPNGIDPATYKKDLAECRQLTEQVESKIGEGIITGAIVGAIFGNIMSTDTHTHTRHGWRGRHRTTVHEGKDRTATGAKIGAVSGALSGAGGTAREREMVMRNCLADRGYRILN